MSVEKRGGLTGLYLTGVYTDASVKGFGATRMTQRNAQGVESARRGERIGVAGAAAPPGRIAPAEPINEFVILVRGRFSKHGRGTPMHFYYSKLGYVSPRPEIADHTFRFYKKADPPNTSLLLHSVPLTCSEKSLKACF